MRLIPAFKDDGAWLLARLLSRRLAVAVAACQPPSHAVLVPVPSRPAAVRRRGIDHMWTLARLAARSLGIRASRLLWRLDGGDAQHTQGRSGREQLVAASFRSRPCPHPVILVDDVATTGTSLAVTQEVLQDRGVLVLAAAVIGDANLMGTR